MLTTAELHLILFVGGSILKDQYLYDPLVFQSLFKKVIN